MSNAVGRDWYHKQNETFMILLHDAKGVGCEEIKTAD